MGSQSRIAMSWWYYSPDPYEVIIIVWQIQFTVFTLVASHCGAQVKLADVHFLSMIWTIKTLFFLVFLRWLTRLSAYIISEGRVYNPDVTRNALDFMKRKVSEENWTEMSP